MEIVKNICLIGIVIFCIGCQSKESIELMNNKDFVKMLDGKNIQLFTLKNEKGTTSQITNYGGKVVSLWVLDKNGIYKDVVLGFDNIDQYITAKEKYFGALIGRYGNRIAYGKFVLNDSVYSLAANNGKNHLHGGNKGYNDVVWDATQISDSKLELSYLSRDGEEGYPGNVQITVVYKLRDDNSLAIYYKAKTDKATPINLTHHSFFNLNGAGNGTINHHSLQINASNFTPVNNEMIPTGKIKSVEGTPFDFRKQKSIGKDIEETSEQLKFGLGYDHNFVLDGVGLRQVASVIGDETRIQMDVITDEPGLQFYGGNFLNGKSIGKYGQTYQYQTAFCLETQHFPDSPNQPKFPSTILNPGELYEQTCIYKFSVNP